MTQDTTTPRVAVVGCGYWGKNLVRNFHQLGALAAVCETTPAGRAAAEAVAPQIPIVDDIETVLAGDTRGVVIATPAETHYDLARRALEAGKDVFVEKPLFICQSLDTMISDPFVHNGRQRCVHRFGCAGDEYGGIAQEVNKSAG